MRSKVHIQNLKCGGCAHTIVQQLSQQKNVSEVEVDQEAQTVSFDFHSQHDFERIKHLLSAIGYPIVGEENKLNT